MISDTSTPPLKLGPPPEWWALRSRLSGKFITAQLSTKNEHLDFVGPVLVFFDQADALREAVAHRETYPALLIEACPLPLMPPVVVRPARFGDDEVLSSQFTVVRGDEVVTVEIRPATLCARATLITMLQLIIELAAERIAGARVSPLYLLSAGPRCAQLELRPPTSEVA